MIALEILQMRLVDNLAADARRLRQTIEGLREAATIDRDIITVLKQTVAALQETIDALRQTDRGNRP